MVAAIEAKKIIELRGIRKAFDSNVILEEAALDVYEGETLTVIGESGSGKSVFLKMMVGLVVPDAGQVLFEGQDVNEMDSVQLQTLRKKAGYVFQSDALFDSMNVFENVGFGLIEHTRQSISDIRDRVVECLEMVGLDANILESMPADLSGGMRRRVALARAIAVEPEVLVYDEPMAGLDPQNITRIGNMIEELQKKLGVTSVIATHEVATAFEISDRIAMLHDRRFRYVGTPAELRQSDSTDVHEFIDEALAAAHRHLA